MIFKFKSNKETIEQFIDEFHVGKKIKYQLIQEKKIVKTNEGFELTEKASGLIPYKGKIEVVYEDDSVLIVNKPSGILVHSDGVEEINTLLNRVVYYYHGKIDVKVIHRIDKDTSGLVMFSKNILAHAYLNYQMENGLIKKEYECITHGKFAATEGVIDEAIGSNRHENNKYLVTKNGKKAITEYKIINSKKDMNLVKVNLITGRTHQIRVHMSHTKHPIYSDKIYYHDEGMKLQLLSRKLTFISPDDFKVREVTTKEGLKLW